MTHSQGLPSWPVSVVSVDDNPADIELLRHLLSSSQEPAFEFKGVLYGPQAAEELVGLSPEILLLDFHMGGTTGIEFLKALRTRGLQTPAILLTGQGDEELAVNALHDGFGDYISKGVLSGQSLRRSICNVLEKHRLKLQAQTYQEQLERTVEDLESKNREISSFYHTLAHELKTPLTGAREFISLVLDGIVGEVNQKQAELLSSALSSCDQLNHCINDLFDVSRIETGKLTVDRKPHHLVDVLRETLACVEPKAREKQVELVLEVAASLPEIELDSRRIHQVINNLIENALKFTPSGGSIKVSCAADEEGYQRLAVEDTGVGISEEDLCQVFERLYQTQGNAAVKGGMGLGLHLCQELVRLHDGEIDATSELGVGSCFSFRLPA